MSLPPPDHARDEAQFLESLRPQYEGQGYAFIIHPGPGEVPDFLGSYRPDAIARKEGSKIAIEVKRRLTHSVERSLEEIRRLFVEHPDWQLVVAYMGRDPAAGPAIAPASPSLIRSRMEEVRSLVRANSQRAAFVMAWALLEAALHRLADSGRRPLSPATIVQALAMLGFFDPVDERRMRELADLRNRVVHGDLAAEPTEQDVERLLLTIDATLGESRD